METNTCTERATAAGGAEYQCNQRAGHDHGGAHGNSDVGVIWGTLPNGTAYMMKVSEPIAIAFRRPGGQWEISA